MSHMSSIGFAVSQEEFQSRISLAAADAARFDTPIGSYLQWEVGAGVELWLQANAVNQIVGCNPHFYGEGRMEVAIIETVSASGRPLDGHCFGWAAPHEPGNPFTGIHAFAANLPDFAFVDERILIPPIVTLQVAAFASWIDCFPTESGYLTSELGQHYSAQQGVGAWVHVENEGLPQPEVYVTGRVTASDRKINNSTGQVFHSMVVQTDAGTIDVVADLEVSPRRPVTGSFIAGVFWLSARIVSELPPPRRPLPFQRARSHA